MQSGRRRPGRPRGGLQVPGGAGGGAVCVSVCPCAGAGGAAGLGWARRGGNLPPSLPSLPLAAATMQAESGIVPDFEVGEEFHEEPKTYYELKSQPLKSRWDGRPAPPGGGRGVPALRGRGRVPGSPR